MKNKFFIGNILATSLLFPICANAANQFLKNQGIVDIGRKTSSNEIEVPKQYVYTNPLMTPVSNVVIYDERLQSQLFSCETDFLGTETCPSGREDCPSNEHFTDGYSVKNHVVKSYTKICGTGHIKEGVSCFLDNNFDGIKDYRRVIDYSYSFNRSGASNSWGLGDSYDIEPGTHSDKFYAPADGNYYIYLGADDTGWLDIDGVRLLNVYYWGAPQAASVFLTKGDHTLYYAGWDLHGGAWWLSAHVNGPNGALLWNSRSGQVLNEVRCPSEYVISNDNCYINANCPSYTTEQPDGSCKMEYDWYEYKCPTDINYYQNPWQVRNHGSDCGNPTCTNSSTPPLNNCVQVDYTCPIDTSAKCGKTNANENICDAGYVWHDNRCERLESYCGSSVYNSLLDICQEFTYYTKLCTNPTDTYNSITNTCESSTIICDFGTYNLITKSCTMAFVGGCALSGYSYDSATESCINPTKTLCSNPQYHYDSSKNECIGEMNFCEADYTFNTTTLKCEKNKCGILGTLDNGTRCETTSQCLGTLTSSGACIPNVIQP